MIRAIRFELWRSLSLMPLSLVLVAHAWAQDATPKASSTGTIAFDTLSITPAVVEKKGTSLSIDNTSFVGSGITLEAILERAYGVRKDQVFGLTDGAAAARFDIDARTLEPTDAATLKLMLQQMLADRFHLQAHLERKSLPVYDLMVVEGGAKLHMADQSASSSVRIADNHMTTASVSMARMANYMADRVHRIVIDKTGLKGGYAVDLQWAGNGEGNLTEEKAIIAALPVQVGLKLEPAEAEVKTLVVDRLELATK